MAIRVVLVDDNDTTRRNFRFHLADDGEIEVVGETGDGDAAIELIERVRPDVVMTDIAHPGLDGYDLIHRLRLQGRDVKIVVHSAYSSPMIIERCFSLGADGYVILMEPHSVLVDAVRTVMRGERFTSPLVADLAVAALKRGQAPKLKPSPRRGRVGS